MHTTHSAVRAGSVTSTSDNAPGQGCVIGQQSKLNGNDSATKAIATAIATAACLGIECHAVGRDRWLLRHARGTDIGVVQGPGALIAAVGGFVSATDDVRALVQRLAAAKVERRVRP